MKTVPVAEAKKFFGKIMKDAQKEEIIITRHGRPVASIQGIEGKTLLEIAAEEKRSHRQRRAR